MNPSSTDSLSQRPSLSPWYGQQVWTSEGLKINLDLSYISAPEPEGGMTPGYFPMRSQRHQKRPQSCPRPEEMTHYPHLTSNQSTSSRTPNPKPECLVISPCMICKLHAIVESGLLTISFPFSSMVPFINKNSQYFSIVILCVQCSALLVWGG